MKVDVATPRDLKYFEEYMKTIFKDIHRDLHEIRSQLYVFNDRIKMLEDKIGIDKDNG